MKFAHFTPFFQRFILCLIFGLLAEFLKMIGVDENIANIDAVEHHIHSETLKN
jgi:hypothetical protein